jgi:hypothetical protein
MHISEPINDCAVSQVGTQVIDVALIWIHAADIVMVAMAYWLPSRPATTIAAPIAA